MTLSCKLLLPWGLNFLRVWIGSTTQGWKLGGREEEGKKGKYTIRIRTIFAILSLLPLPPSPRSALLSISSQHPSLPQMVLIPIFFLRGNPGDQQCQTWRNPWIALHTWNKKTKKKKGDLLCDYRFISALLLAFLLSPSFSIYNLTLRAVVGGESGGWAIPFFAFPGYRGSVHISLPAEEWRKTRSSFCFWLLLLRWRRGKSLGRSASQGKGNRLSLEGFCLLVTYVRESSEVREFVQISRSPSCKSLRALFYGWRLLVVDFAQGRKRKYTEGGVDMHIGALDSH